jgi:predicted TIM-barrel fold metal-dependent hydrolase
MNLPHFLRSNSRIIGTDHPFFPPLDTKEKKWASVEDNLLAISEGFIDTDEMDDILGNNAYEILRLN